MHDTPSGPFSSRQPAAKYSFDNRLDGILVNSVPPCVVNIVSNECTGVAG